MSANMLLKSQSETTQIPLQIHLNELQNDSNCNIFFKEKWLSGINTQRLINNPNLSTTLHSLLKHTPLDFIEIEDYYFIVPKQKLSVYNLHNNKTTNKSDWNQYRVIGACSNPGDEAVVIQGFILDGTTDKEIPLAQLKVKNTDYYAIANFEGKYSLTIPPGYYNIEVNSLGYQNTQLKWNIQSASDYNITLFKESLEIDEVTIEGDNNYDLVDAKQMSMLRINPKSLRLILPAIGEPDIIKSFSTLPGVSSASEFGSGINVRGSSDDQNLFLIENSTLYNTSHVMGLISVINPDAVKSVDLYKGNMPIRYGQRASSVIDIKIDDVTINKTRLKGGIGLYTSRLMLESPVAKQKAVLKVAARTSYSDYLLTKMPDYNLQNSSASFYDLTSSLHLKLKNNPVTLFAYHSYDYFKYNNLQTYNYYNTLFSARHNHQFSKKLCLETIASYSRYTLDNEQNADDLRTYLTQSMISSATANTILKQDINDKSTAIYGVQFTHYDLAQAQQSILPQQQEISSLSPEKANELSIYTNYNRDFSNRLNINCGIRYNYYQYSSDKNIYEYETTSLGYVISDSITSHGDGPSYSRWEPRASIRYMVTPQSSLKLSYNTVVQHVSKLSYSAISSPNDVWKLSDTYIKPTYSNQIALGYYHNMFNSTYKTSVELYYKKLNHLHELNSKDEYLSSPHIETEIVDATGQNYGLELMIKKEQGKLKSTLSYTYSRAWKQTNGNYFYNSINSNSKYASQYDTPHAINVTASYSYNQRVRWGASFSFNSGRPVTLPEYTYYVENEKMVYYSDRNKYRLPSYHRLDLSLSIDESLKIKKRWKGSWTFALLNVYGRKNAYSIFYKKDTPTEENNYQSFSMYKMYLIGIPLPTITYNFIF